MLRALLLTAAWGLASSVGASPAVTLPDPPVTYHGRLVGHVDYFDGIRYAQAPVGDLRFAPPRPFAPAPGAGVQATRKGPSCPQATAAAPPLMGAVDDVDEDCLNLRIARPANTAADARLPVLVWLHGGGGIRGSPYDAHFDPYRLVGQSVANGQPVIYAAVSFRQGFFAYARTPALLQAKSLNNGLRDQWLALAWIKDNIEHFGGDPSRVTVFGQSAGGSAIGLHHLAYGGAHRPPFDQAYMTSGPPGTWLNQSSAAVETNSAAVATRLGCDPVKLAPAKLVACLRKHPWQQVLEASLAVATANHPPFGIMTFTPTVDGDFLPDRSSVLLREGRFSKDIPAVLLWTEDDGSVVVDEPESLVSDEHSLAPLRAFAANLTAAQHAQYLALYPAASFAGDAAAHNAHRPISAPALTPHHFRAAAFMRDMLFTCPSIYFSHQVLAHASPSFDKVYLATLNQSALVPWFAKQGVHHVRASHNADITYLFAGLLPEGSLSESDRALARDVSSGLVQFAYTGRPADELAWPVAHPQPLRPDRRGSVPDQINLLVVGGELGTTPVALVRVAEDKKGAADADGDASRFGAADLQALLPGSLDSIAQAAMRSLRSFAAMKPRKQVLAQQRLEGQDLFTRCEFVHGLADSLSI